MLTETQVRTAKPGNCARKLFDARGLYLHVMPNGGKYWRFNFRFKGKYKTLSLGVYPDVPLAKARDRHQKARQLLADKVDPCVEKKASSYTFETVARSFRPLRSEERAGIMETRLRLVRAAGSESLDSVVARSKSIWPAEMVAVANGIETRQPLAVAQQIKVVIPEPYRGQQWK